MADFPDIMLTNQGLNMVALAQAGQQLIFTKVVLGNGTLTEDLNIQDLTEVISPKLELGIAAINNNQNGQVDIEVRVNNATLSKGFFCRECGVYGKIGESGVEQLYSYTNAGSMADYLPPNTNSYNDIFVISTVVGNSANVKLMVDDSIIYATRNELVEHKSDIDAHKDILARATPAGTVIYFAGNVPPQGYLKCNGAELLRSDYRELFTAIGTIYGEGDGNNTFKLPDLRGEFVRGWDDERGVDENRELGSGQLDAFEDHDHAGVHFGVDAIGYRDTTAGVGSPSTGWTHMASYQGANYADHSPRPRTAKETRPRNVALMACIKY